jgi:hypothetical protein
MVSAVQEHLGRQHTPVPVPVDMGNCVIMQTLDPAHGGTRTLGLIPCHDRATGHH